MGDKFEDLRQKVKGIILSKEFEGVLLAIIDEIERIHNELRQGFTKPE